MIFRRTHEIPRHTEALESFVAVPSSLVGCFGEPEEDSQHMFAFVDTMGLCYTISISPGWEYTPTASFWECEAMVEFYIDAECYQYDNRTLERVEMFRKWLESTICAYDAFYFTEAR